ncbi:MAG: endonuclease/exonuclease/phosphatase family protein [Planctomycetes bacterium]|nr:endonuclease/exonuclease/phosphatase family protein [Planctomycetota bacterium]
MRHEFAACYPEIRFYGSVHPIPAGGFGVLSSLPVVRERFVPAEHGLFGFCLLDVRDGDRVIQVANVHLQPVMLPRSEEPANLLSVMAAFEAAEQMHRKEIEAVVARLDGDKPTIIAGDFNSASHFQAPSLLVERGFTDSFAAVHDEPELHSTWRWPTRYGTAALRIDYVFHCAAFRTRESRIIAGKGSDHSLLVSEVELITGP